jgi:predicted Zn-dependent protease
VSGAIVTPTQPVKLIQALALFDEKNSLDYGLALWAAFHEIESFYRMTGTAVEYRRFYIAPKAPASSLLDGLLHRLGSVLPGGQVVRALELLNQDQIISSAAPSAEMADSTKRTYDQVKLASIIRNLIDSGGHDSHLMIITDRPITPPRKWRYIIWQEDPDFNSSVISVAPLDPHYWRDLDPDRVMTIKRRMRNAGLSITGGLIGISHCKNERCFLFDDVDSVTVLDDMLEMGSEHGIEAISGAGFDDDRVKDPTALQPVVVRPEQKRSRR